MINQKVVEYGGKLRSCHRIFYGAISCASIIALITFILVLGIISQGGSGLAIYAGAMLLVFFWAIFIFYREDKILTQLVVRADVVQSGLQVQTIFGKVSILDHYKITDLDLSWLKRRRIWPSYFLDSNDNGIYPKYSWQNIKCFSMSSEKEIFYWISDNKSSDLKAMLSRN